MKRATTVTHTFSLPFSYVAYISKVLITYKQRNEIVFTKDENQIEVRNDKDILVKLSQEDTKQFLPNIPVKIEIRALTLGGDAIASDIIETRVENVLNDEVLQ